MESALLKSKRRIETWQATDRCFDDLPKAEILVW
jgi:hypothetical protein